MYAAVLFAHSWLRWIVLGSGLCLLVASASALRTGGAWSPGHERVHVGFLAVLDAQMLLGFALYLWLSPITIAVLADLAALKDPQLRFYGIEHAATMLLAVVVAHAGRVRAKRRHGGARHRATLVTQAVWLVLTLAAIPWPGLDVGRPLFRT